MTIAGDRPVGVEAATPTIPDTRSRMIDRWFPCAEVDAAVGTPAGSGRSEKALFTWFASRPIAQARAAILTTLLPDVHDLRADVRAAIKSGDENALSRLRTAIAGQYPDGRPVVLDIFSGRGLIPLEAARARAVAVGTDLSPVATLAGRLLGDFPLRDWSSEPPLPFNPESAGDIVGLFDRQEPRLLADVRTVLSEIEARVATTVEPFFPKAANGKFPWAYLWAVTIPCDHCKRRFPLVGSMRLQFPSARDGDRGQSLRFEVSGDNWRADVIAGDPDQEPTFSAAAGRKGKSARCLFPDCKHVHALEAVKAKGVAQEYEDALLLVGEENEGLGKTFRRPSARDLAATASVDLGALGDVGHMSAVPDEPIPPGNQDTIRASGYGYRTYGDLMNNRQTLLFVETVRAIRAVHAELRQAVSSEYAAALTAYATANLQRRLRYSTRGARLRAFGGNANRKGTWVQVHDVFSEESKVSFQFDYLEAGPGTGPGTWDSVTNSGLNALTDF